MSAKLSQYRPFILPSYRLNEFSFCLKLNQRIKAAAIIYKPKYKNKGDTFFQKVTLTFDTPPIHSANKECYPPILCIRKWKKWLQMKSRKSKYNFKCEKLNITKWQNTSK
jgi:hypothetical protein